MRLLSQPLFWMFNSRRGRRSVRSIRQGYRLRPATLLKRLLHLFWGIAWALVGLALAFSPEFRSAFIQFWTDFAQLMTVLARELVDFFSQLLS